MATTFAKRIEKAASDFPGGQTYAWVQYTMASDGHTVQVGMQAPDVYKELRQGPVGFGAARDSLDVVGNIRIRNSRYPVAGTRVIVETEFGAPGQGFDAFARFVAEADTATYKIPDFDPSVVGIAQLREADIVTCRALVSRAGHGATVNLLLGGIHKEAFFTSQVSNKRIDQSGVMFFNDLARLKTRPNRDDNCVATYSAGGIVFRMENAANEIVARFIPNKPMDDIGPIGTPPKVTWEDMDSA